MLHYLCSLERAASAGILSFTGESWFCDVISKTLSAVLRAHVAVLIPEQYVYQVIWKRSFSKLLCYSGRNRVKEGTSPAPDCPASQFITTRLFVLRRPSYKLKCICVKPLVFRGAALLCPASLAPDDVQRRYGLALQTRFYLQTVKTT